MKAYRIRNWQANFETSESRKRKTQLGWIALPTQMDGKRFRRLSRIDDAAEIFGAWCLLLEIAGRCPCRGLLVDDHGMPVDAEAAADSSGFQQASFEKAFKVLSEPRIGWLEVVNLPEPAENPADTGKIRSYRTEPKPKPNKTEQDLTEEGAGDSDSDISSVDISDSDSISPELARQVFLLAVDRFVPKSGDQRLVGRVVPAGCPPRRGVASARQGDGSCEGRRKIRGV